MSMGWGSLPGFVPPIPAPSSVFDCSTGPHHLPSFYQDLRSRGLGSLQHIWTD